MLRAQFYAKSAAEPVPVAEEVIDTTDTVRDDSVMDSMRENTVTRLMEEKAEELSFEERLERGKRSAYDEVIIEAGSSEPEEEKKTDITVEETENIEEAAEATELTETAEEPEKDTQQIQSGQRSCQDTDLTHIFLT